MSPYAKVALSVLRLIAFGCIILSLALYSTDYALYLRHRPMSGWGMLALKGAPFLAGLVLGWNARALAEHLTRDLD
jgi:hypothetical protein